MTQNKASELSKNMYNNILPFTSDLINSYAWDTAIVFEQAFDNRTTDKTWLYSKQNSLNTSLATTGTNNLTDTTKQDKICNIWDMASNCWEWTTETYSYSNYPCVNRGGGYRDSCNYTSSRYSQLHDRCLQPQFFPPTLIQISDDIFYGIYPVKVLVLKRFIPS